MEAENSNQVKQMDQSEIELELEKINRNTRLSILVCIVIVLIIAACAIYMNTWGSDDWKINRAITTQGRDYLKYNPDKATFSRSDETTITIDSSGLSANVTGWVDAYNGFGVDSQVNYSAGLDKDANTGQWTLDTFTLDQGSDNNSTTGN